MSVDAVHMVSLVRLIRRRQCVRASAGSELDGGMPTPSWRVSPSCLIRRRRVTSAGRDLRNGRLSAAMYVCDVCMWCALCLCAHHDVRRDKGRICWRVPSVLTPWGPAPRRASAYERCAPPAFRAFSNLHTVRPLPLLSHATVHRRPFKNENTRGASCLHLHLDIPKYCVCGRADPPAQPYRPRTPPRPGGSVVVAPYCLYPNAPSRLVPYIRTRARLCVGAIGQMSASLSFSLSLSGSPLLFLFALHLRWSRLQAPGFRFGSPTPRANTRFFVSLVSFVAFVHLVCSVQVSRRRRRRTYRPRSKRSTRSRTCSLRTPSPWTWTSSGRPLCARCALLGRFSTA